MKNKKIINICIFMVIICFALSGCNDNKNKNENVATSTDTEISEEVTTEKADKNTTETTTNKVTTEEAETTEVEDKTTAATTVEQKPATTQAPATTEAPKPQTTQAPATTEAPKPQTTQAPATTQATTEAPSTTEHQHTWESVGHTETHDYRSDTGADVTGQQISIVDGQRCIITGYIGGYQCLVCGTKVNSAQEIDDHVWGTHNGEANYGTWQEPIYVAVTQKSIYVEDYQRCSTCGATK